ncbi:MAG: ATP-binding protein, partial [Mycoplasmataceae bacterium]|nr:ATP-binding protein [Mycoplasmataceae bacterium]
MKILKIDEAKKIIEKMESSNFTWFPLGGKTNNAGIIEMISDPNSALTERLTNAIDAVLEKEVSFFSDDFNSPYELSDQIIKKYNKKYLENRVSVILHKSGELNKMTIEVLDTGIGIVQEEFTQTILELNGSNKLNKKYLMGAFGQGGSTSVKFNEYTIIYSRKNNKEHFTIIRYNEGDENTKNGIYEFLALQKRKTLSFAPSNELLEDGTSIINIAMEYARTGSINGASNSIFSALTNKLFNPCFSITFRDERTPNQLISEQKKLKGVPYNLAKIKKNYSGTHIIRSKSDNEILVSWWLIMPD